MKNEYVLVAMKQDMPLGNERGLVISDLHLFARRSDGMVLFDSLRDKMAGVQHLVLNGDTFDFRWSTLSDHPATIEAALQWLRDLANDFPQCQVHYVYGNHDCLAAFHRALAAQNSSLPRFHLHDDVLRLGTALFLHGDCAHGALDADAFRELRQTWRWDRRSPRWLASGYICVDRLGLTWLAHRCFFPRRKTVRRIVSYLDEANSGWRAGAHDCYFGHTHLPFTHFVHEGIRFHNTGSAIRGMCFNPIFFETAPAVAVV